MKETILFWWSEIPYLPLFGLHSSVMPPVVSGTDVACKLSEFLVCCWKIFTLISLQCMPLHGSQKSCITETKVQGGLKCTQLT